MKEKKNPKNQKRTAVTIAVVTGVCLLAAGGVLFAALSGAFSNESERETKPVASAQLSTRTVAATTAAPAPETSDATAETSTATLAATAEETSQGEEAHTYIPPAATRQHTEPAATEAAPQKMTRLP